MISKLIFPEGINYVVNYINGYDFCDQTFIGPESLEYGYAYSRAYVIRIQYDTSNVKDTSAMFYYGSNIISISLFDTSNVTDMSYMFNNCSSLITIPQLDTSNVTNMSNMFYYCSSLITIPQLDTSNVTNVSYMFYNDTSLKEIPDLNLSKITNFGGSQYSTWTYSCSRLEKIGVIDCDSVTNISYVLSGSQNNNLKHLGGFKNLGKTPSLTNTNSNYFMYLAPNLTYESIMNVLNLLYDRAAAGLSNLTLKLHTNHIALLSEEDKLIAINKGWTITA